MIRKALDCPKKYNENMRGGNGIVEITEFATPTELNEKGRLFAKITLKPGCGIGFHTHEGEGELFHILSGTAQYSDNGEIVTVQAGDVTVCPPGTGHSICNQGEETVELIAVILHA